ncbi:MAG: hypothetical protein ACRD2Q_01095 [Terriglobales bacterium]
MVTTEHRYRVELSNTFTNDLGEMSEMQLLGYLKNRPLLGRTAEEVLSELEQKDSVTVNFEPPLASHKPTVVKIHRISMNQ